MASDSPAATIASHSPKKGGFQAAGRRSPGSSLLPKISMEAFRSRWEAFLWRNKGEGGWRTAGTEGMGRDGALQGPGAASPAVAHRASRAGKYPLPQAGPRTDMEGSSSSVARGTAAGGAVGMRGQLCLPLAGHGKAFCRASRQNKDVPQPCRGRPCKFWCERRDLNPYG